LKTSAAEAPLCLSCHVSPALARQVDPKETAMFAWVGRERAFGVGCEACHGSATSWLEEHLAPSWPKDATEKQKRGMTNLSDPAVLTRTCAGCHVGAAPSNGVPARDVNHDLIAAGHPRLAFEISSFFANLPKHWKQPKVYDEPKLWAVGQVVSAEASLALLKQRADDVQAPWPEFADYDCAACHHDLAKPSWRQAQGSRRRLGGWAWGTWTMTLPRVLAEQLVPPLELPETTKLRRLLNGPATMRGAVALQAVQASEELGGLRDRLGAGTLDAERLRNALVASTWIDEEPSWDSAEQTYLALYALTTRAQDEPWRKRLEALLDLRVWPRDGAAPSDFVPHEFAKKLRN
jgi:hypothetical protein